MMGIGEQSHRRVAHLVDNLQRLRGDGSRCERALYMRVDAGSLYRSCKSCVWRLLWRGASEAVGLNVSIFK